MKIGDLVSIEDEEYATSPGAASCCYSQYVAQSQGEIAGDRDYVAHVRRSHSKDSSRSL